MELGGKGVAAVFLQPNIELNIEVAKLQTFNREASKILGFLMTYRLYIKMKMRNILVKE